MIAWNLFDILWALFYVLGVFVAMFFLNPGLAAAVVLIVPILSLLTAYFQNRILHWNRRVRKMNSRITSAYNEGIMGARTSKTLVIEEQNSREFETVSGEMKTASVRAARLSAVYIPLVMFFSSLTTAIVLARGGSLVLSNLLLIGTLSAFTSYAVGIFEPIQQIARNIADLLSLQANIERVMGLLGGGAAHPRHAGGDRALRHGLRAEARELGADPRQRGVPRRELPLSGRQ